MRRLQLYIVILLVFCLSGNASAIEIRNIDLNLTTEQISLTFFDLNNGEATLIQTGQGKSFLINSGGSKNAKQLLKNLETFGIKVLEGLIMTNEEKEYSSGVQAIVEEVPTNQLIVPSSLFSEFKDRFSSQGLLVKQWNERDKFELSPNVNIHVLGVDKNISGERGMVFTLTFGENRVLYMGITNNKLEKRIQKELFNKEIKIFKVPEFAQFGTTQPFLESIKPQMAVIFHRKNYLPSMNIIERLNETWIDIYQTNQIGDVTVKLDKQSYEVITIENQESFNRLTPQQ